jgi:hypothetical protein
VWRIADRLKMPQFFRLSPLARCRLKIKIRHFSFFSGLNRLNGSTGQPEIVIHIMETGSGIFVFKAFCH